MNQYECYVKANAVNTYRVLVEAESPVEAEKLAVSSENWLAEKQIDVDEDEFEVVAVGSTTPADVKRMLEESESLQRRTDPEFLKDSPEDSE